MIDVSVVIITRFFLIDENGVVKAALISRAPKSSRDSVEQHFSTAPCNCNCTIVIEQL